MPTPVVLKLRNRDLAEALLENAEYSILEGDPDEPEAHPIYLEIQRLKAEHGFEWDRSEWNR